MKKAIVTGAGGFIGSHLMSYLKSAGYWVRGIDVKQPEFMDTEADEFVLADLRNIDATERAMSNVGRPDEVYALAADMGGMGFISSNHVQIMRNNMMINFNTIEAAKRVHARRYFFASSACVYPRGLQTDTIAKKLSENDAYPADPEDAYGWEKLTTEKTLGYYMQEYDIPVRIARFHNVYGPRGTYKGGREKAPAAMCRKIAFAKLSKRTTIDVWGDGKQTRSFMYIDDCVDGIVRIMRQDKALVMNLGSDRLISINGLADMISTTAGYFVEKLHVAGPQGVRGRNSDNTVQRNFLSWEPRTDLETGLARTYEWVEEQVKKELGV